MSILDLPSMKLFIKELSRATRCAGDQSTSTKIPVWQVLDARGTKTFSLVWLQGIVVETMLGGDVLYVDDGTAVAEITGCHKIPASCPKVKTGQYVMVIGLLISPESPIVRAIKIQDLSTCVSAEPMWLLEVVDQSFMCR